MYMCTCVHGCMPVRFLCICIKNLSVNMCSALFHLCEQFPCSISLSIFPSVCSFASSDMFLGLILVCLFAFFLLQN